MTNQSTALNSLGANHEVEPDGRIASPGRDRLASLRSKRCPDCGLTKPVDEFPRKASTKDSLYAYCRECNGRRCRSAYLKNRERRLGRAAAYHEANQERARQNSKALTDSRRRFLWAVKLTCGCVDCGYDENPAKLHFDHRPGSTKEFDPARGVSYSWVRLVAEINKCDVRCASCHSRRHHLEDPSLRRRSRPGARSKACSRGHSWTEQNTHTDVRGIRRCRICRAAAERRRKQTTVMACL